jgi:hypothetical protein
MGVWRLDGKSGNGICKKHKGHNTGCETHHGAPLFETTDMVVRCTTKPARIGTVRRFDPV